MVRVGFHWKFEHGTSSLHHVCKQVFFPASKLSHGRIHVGVPSSLTTLDGSMAKGYKHGPLLYNCALTPPGRGSRLFLPGPVSTRRILPVGLTWPVGKPFPPYTQWCCCRSIRPRHWGTCTRVIMIRKFFRNFMLRQTSRFGRRRLRRGQWVVRCPLWWSRNTISDWVWLTQTGLFGDAVKNFAQQFSAVQKQFEANSHILPWRSAVASTLPPAAPQPAHRQGQPPAAAPFPRRSSSLHPSGTVEPVVSGVPSPSRSPPRGAAKPGALGRATWRWLRLLFRRRWLHRSFPWRRAG